MSLALAAGVVVAFAGSLHLLGMPRRAGLASRRARECLDTLRDDALDDREKERRLRVLSLRLFGLTGILLGGGLLALALPLGGVWLLERAGVASLSGVLAVLERPDFLAAVTGAGLAGYLIVRRARRK